MSVYKNGEVVDIAEISRIYRAMRARIIFHHAIYDIHQHFGGEGKLS